MHTKWMYLQRKTFPTHKIKYMLNYIVQYSVKVCEYSYKLQREKVKISRSQKVAASFCSWNSLMRLILHLLEYLDLIFQLWTTSLA